MKSTQISLTTKKNSSFSWSLLNSFSTVAITTPVKMVLSSAIIFLALIITACSDSGDTPKNNLSKIVIQGETYLAQQQFKAAMIAARKAIATEPSNSVGYLIMVLDNQAINNLNSLLSFWAI